MVNIQLPEPGQFSLAVDMWKQIIAWVATAVVALAVIGSLTPKKQATANIKPAKTTSPVHSVHTSSASQEPTSSSTTATPAVTVTTPLKRSLQSAITRPAPAPVTATRTTVAAAPVTPAPPPPTSSTVGASCHPLTNSGNCYEPGEFCRKSDHGVTGVAGDGERITCENNNGWRWEPT
jgi:hypothetical protein